MMLVAQEKRIDVWKAQKNLADYNALKSDQHTQRNFVYLISNVTKHHNKELTGVRKNVVYHYKSSYNEQS
jgi:hypothetical protein